MYKTIVWGQIILMLLAVVVGGRVYYCNERNKTKTEHIESLIGQEIQGIDQQKQCFFLKTNKDTYLFRNIFSNPVFGYYYDIEDSVFSKISNSSFYKNGLYYIKTEKGAMYIIRGDMVTKD